MMSTSIITTVVPHFTAGGIEAQRDQVTYSKPHSKLDALPVSKLLGEVPHAKGGCFLPHFSLSQGGVTSHLGVSRDWELSVLKSRKS